MFFVGNKNENVQETDGNLEHFDFFRRREKHDKKTDRETRTPLRRHKRGRGEGTAGGGAAGIPWHGTRPTSSLWGEQGQQMGSPIPIEKRQVEEKEDLGEPVRYFSWRFGSVTKLHAAISVCIDLS